MENVSFKLAGVYSQKLGNLASLSAVQKQQLMRCAELYFGEEEAAGIDMNDIGNLFDEEEERWFQAECYHVIDEDTKEIMLDFWYYNVDSGTVFMHNSLDYAGFEMIQFSIDLIEKNEFNEKFPDNFAEILHEAFKKKQKEDRNK